MAIIVICKKCLGTGKVEKKLFNLFNVKMKCPICHGKGKRDISNVNHLRHS